MKYFLFSVLMIVLMACQSKVVENQGEQQQFTVQVIEQQQHEEKIKKDPIWENCYCEERTNFDHNFYCDTTYLKDKSFLYYQYTCDSIWLTLEDKIGNKLILISDSVYIHPTLTFRLGYSLTKEYSNHILLRHGCSGSSPCLFSLIEKKTGKLTRSFEKLVVDNDLNFYDFVLYLDYTDYHNFRLVVDYIEQNKRFSVPIDLYYACKVDLEVQFDTTIVNDDILTVQYRNYYEGCEEYEEVEIKIDLEKERLIKN